ncbi:MAG: FHA domain-containing protein [Pseudomonadota bacterium]
MAIVVEVLDASGQRVAMQQFSGPEIVIGRAYDCDFILQDPHVDPHHCRISLAGEPVRYSVQDEDSLNGTRVNSLPLNGAATELASGSHIILGKTRLRISDPALGVAPAEKLGSFNAFVEWASNPLVVLCSVALVAVYSAVTVYQQSDAAFKLSFVFGGWFGEFTLIVVIVGFWSLIGRISKRKASIGAHATIACLMWVLITFCEQALEIGLYNFNGMASSYYLVPIISGLLIVAGQFIHLSLASNLRLGARALVVVMMLCVFPGLSLYSIVESRGEFSRAVNTPAIILPPAWNVGGGVQADSFVEKSSVTFSNAQQEVVNKNAAGDEEQSLIVPQELTPPPGE